MFQEFFMVFHLFTHGDYTMHRMNSWLKIFMIVALALMVFKGAALAQHVHGSPEPDPHQAHGADSAQQIHDDHSAHQVFQVPENEPAPALTVRVFDDPVSGWNLQLVTENFTFAPYHAGLNHIPGEGHAHLYINDIKFTRILGPWYHLDRLPGGENTVRVALSTNDHQYYSVNDQIVEDSVVITAQLGDKSEGCPCPQCKCPRCQCPGRGHGMMRSQ
jgi:hypothetical protein